MKARSVDQALLSVDEALARVIGAAQPMGVEIVPLAAARNRVLAADQPAAHALPLFDQSAVDGYALRHAELAGLPCTLPLGAPIAARSHEVHPVLEAGTAARILTGGLLPQDADTVVRQEITTRDAASVTVLQSVALGTDVRRCGEEIERGAVVARAGSRLTPGLLGALTMAGVSQVTVYRLPKIVVLVSGDEIVQGGSALQLGQIPDSNGPMLKAFLSNWGVAPLRVEAVADSEAAVSEALQRAFAEADIVLTSGGVSVGDHDYIHTAAESLGAEPLLWRVAQKPGMPLYVARHGKSLLFGLPGNPGSVFASLFVYVRAALDQMQGLDPARRWHTAALPEGVKRDAVKTLWLRVVQTVTDEGTISLQTLPGQLSHMLGNLAAANALMRVDVGESRYVRWCALD